MKSKSNLILITAIALSIPLTAIAQVMNSSNYRLDDSTFDGGGEASNSANYASTESIGGVESGNANSANYQSNGGFEPNAYPGIPGTPTLTNTGGILYNSLDFVVVKGDGQQADTNYAISVSKDDFATELYVQTDDTLGATAAWQTYAGWGGATGERMTGLDPSTAYKVRVKARYGTASESGWSQTATASTVAQNLTVAVDGVNSGTAIAGLTTTVTSTSGAVGYSSLTIGDASPNIAAQKITVTTNATTGYTTTIQQNNNLTTGVDEIDPVAGTNASPAAFGTGVTRGRFGYHTTDSSLCTGTTSRFTSNDTFAAISTSPYEIACHTAPITNDITNVLYKLVVGNLQEAGNYQNTVTYITTASF